MLFNSQFFIFVFLPTTLFVYLLLGRFSQNWALRWIIAASLIFYAWWRPANLLIILPTLVVNFALARTLQHRAGSDRLRLSRSILATGIVFNIAVLGYFKYANFTVTATNDLLGTHFSVGQIILPLGISFIIFQLIAFLIDVYGRRVDEFSFREFCSFVLFFPQLIAGPIVHFREMMPQFRTASCQWNKEDLSVGLTLFVFGLFKKVYIADGIAPAVTAIYAGAAGGEAVSLIPAWLAAVGFTFQIYFDFSGYTDMALGAARLFGIKLPVNFNSPLRSTSIIDFWLRWHVSLTRFLTAYVYNPIALAMTRRRMKSGHGIAVGQSMSAGAYLQIIAVPTIFTMFISGLWHGAGYLFILWGLLHGVYLTINHGWRILAQKYWLHTPGYGQIMRPIGFVLTFVAVSLSMVLFRSNSMDAALNVLSGMAGMNGIMLPDPVYERLGSLGQALSTFGINGGLDNFGELLRLSLWLALLAPIIFLMPNTLQILDRHEPAVGIVPDTQEFPLTRWKVSWSASLRWTVYVAVIAWLAIQNIGGYSEFLYWQF